MHSNAIREPVAIAWSTHAGIASHLKDFGCAGYNSAICCVDILCVQIMVNTNGAQWRLHGLLELRTHTLWR